MEDDRRYDKQAFMKNQPSDLEGYGFPDNSSYYGQTNYTNPSYPNFQAYDNRYPQQGYPRPQDQGFGQPQGFAQPRAGAQNDGMMIDNAMPALAGLTNVVGGAYTYLDKAGILDTKSEPLDIKVPKCLHTCYQKVMERKTPREPYYAQCQRCGQAGQTQIKSDIGVGTIGCTALICCCAPTFFWFPFVIDNCYDHSHKCQNCGNIITKEKFLLGTDGQAFK